MYKGLCLTLLLLFMFVLAQRAPASAPDTTLASPAIVASGSFPNQTAGIPLTTIFTPTQDGLYRFSAYATVTKPGFPKDLGYWLLNLYWRDEAGRQKEQGALSANFNTRGPFIVSAFSLPGGNTTILEARAGSPIEIILLQQGGATAGSEYSFHYTLEQLQ